jgi:hypothetical protein
MVSACIEATRIDGHPRWAVHARRAFNWFLGENHLQQSLYDPATGGCLLCRAEDRRGLSHLCAARSVNGVDGWVIDPQPTLWPDSERYPEELWGIEDPRITYVAELGNTPSPARPSAEEAQEWRWRSRTTPSVSSGLVS